MIKYEPKIYIWDTGNGSYGSSAVPPHYRYYMSSDQVDRNIDKIKIDDDGDPYILVKDLSKRDYYDAIEMKKIADEYGVDVESLWVNLDWQHPETLAAELGDR